MVMKKKAVKSQTVTSRPIRHSDDLMRRMWLSLARDFRRNLNGTSFCRRQELALADIKGFRVTSWASLWGSSAQIFKCQTQLKNLFKRYIFADDVSSEILKTDALNGFAAFQVELAAPKKEPGELEYRVLQKARCIIKSVLGEYSEEEHFNFVRAGKRANVGVPYDRSYLDVKMAALTGSLEHQQWFNNYLATDQILQDVLVRCPRDSYQRVKNSDGSNNANCVGPSRAIVDHLTATAVPKSFKANRIIVPNTVLGAMHSYGLGCIIQERLLNAGLDIRHLQKKHGAIVQSASLSRSLVTADLSKASDLFTTALVNRLVPRKWFKVLKLGRVKNIDINGTVSQLSSFMAMGIGYTFPLETLIFWAILKSIATLAGVKGKISVYGDDLIYPRRLHKYVEYLFPKIGLILNTDKTFSDLPFRESCGCDFYKGVDVRPFQPEGSGERLGIAAYRSFCYKMLNGILRRWDVLEIPTTVLMLLKEILSVDVNLKIVPPDFPDESGLHFLSPSSIPLKRKLEMWGLSWHFAIAYPTWNKHLQCHSFLYWRAIGADRSVPYVYPYYWDALRGPEEDHKWNPLTTLQDSKNLRWVKPFPVRGWDRYRSKISGKRFVRCYPVVNRKKDVRYRLDSGVRTF